MSSLNGHHAAGGPSPGAQSSFHPGAYSNISSLSHTSPPSQHMGSGHSKPTKPTPPPPPPTSSSTALKGISAAVAGGFKIKRAFAAKKKKSQDFLPKSAEHDSKSSTQALNITAKNSVLHHQQSSSPPPPPTPPKHVQHLIPSPLNTEQSRGIQLANRASVLPITPGISSAVNYMQQQQQTPPVVDTPLPLKSPRSQPQPQPQKNTPTSEAEKARPNESDKVKSGGTSDNMPDKRESKETWRKSDSTNSHHTIRPGGTGGSTRPVSWAESFQSTHTVVQVSSKRPSALITDADFAMPEEDDESVAPVVPGHPPKSTPPPSMRLKNRRSMSLNLVPPTINKLPISPPLSVSTTEPKRSSRSISEGVPPFLNTQFAISPAQSPPQIKRVIPVRSPISSMFVDTVAGQQSYPSPTSNIRERFAAWTNANSSTDSVSRQDRTLHALPLHQRQASNSQRDRLDEGRASPSTSIPPRPTAISMTASGIGPAAAGLAKRAVEMGRKWGIGLTSSTSGSGSGYSSSSSSIPSSFSSASYTDYGLVKTSSNQSTPSMHSHIVKSTHSHGSVVGFQAGGGKRRTPDAPSGAYSVHSVASKSDNDPFTSSSGPVLGTLLRAGLRNNNGAPVTGGVFGKELSVVTRETGVNVGIGMGSAGVEGGNVKEGLVLELEGRLVPAVVVRCAQHLLIWGVQEEGLFRVNGRPSHVSKLRTEFDSGVDYDMTECNPGELDPHAVASVFKAYLRELPESILTRALSPFFDAAIKKEASSKFPEQNRFLGAERGNLNLPQGEFAVRKPPSLTTLAMPTFTGIPPPSSSLVADIRSLISQLPQENYDLLRTVVDLIKATGEESKKTKMPLSNLLLVFCPSLNMTPPLLKAFCEAEDIWTAESEKDSPPPPLPMKDGQVTIAKSEGEMSDGSEEMENDGEEDEVEGKSLMSSGRASLDTTDDPSSGYRASEEEEASLFEEGQVVRRRWATERDTERSEIPTVYLDTRSHYSSSSASSLHEPSELSGRHRHRHTNSTDDNESVSSANQLVHPNPPISSPLCSSSAESVATPTSEADSSFSQLPLWDDGGGGEKKMHGIGPVEIVDPDSILVLSPAPTTTPRNASVSQSINEDAVQFPQLSTTPSARQAKRISIPLLSLPNLSPASLISFGDEDRPKDNDSPCPSPTSSIGGVVNLLTKRSTRPSLRLLFSKKSGSSLNSIEKRSASGISFISSPIPQQAQSPFPCTWELMSDSSVSTPLSAVTASSGMSSRSHLPPVLDTPIEDSSLSLDLRFDVSPPATAVPLMRDDKMREAQKLVKAESTGLKEAPPPPHTLMVSQTSIVAGPPPPSPLCSLKTEPFPSSSLSLSPSALKRPPLYLENPSSLSFSSCAPSPQLSLPDDDEEDEEDWTQSVLSAADRLS